MLALECPGSTALPVLAISQVVGVITIGIGVMTIYSTALS